MATASKTTTKPDVKWTANSAAIDNMLTSLDARLKQSGYIEDWEQLSFIFVNVFGLTDTNGDFLAEDETILELADDLWERVDLTEFPNPGKAVVAIHKALDAQDAIIAKAHANAGKSTNGKAQQPPVDTHAAEAASVAIEADYLEFGKALRKALAARVGDDKGKQVALLNASCGAPTMSVLYDKDGIAAHWVDKIKKFAFKPGSEPAHDGKASANGKVVLAPTLKTAEEIRQKYTMIIERRDNKKGTVNRNNYLQVAGRVLWFRLENPDGAITTEVVTYNEDIATMKATVTNGNGIIIAAAHASCTPSGAERAAGRYLEKAETSAIGRALGLCGYGTEDIEADDSDGFLADSPAPNNA